MIKMIDELVKMTLLRYQNDNIRMFLRTEKVTDLMQNIRIFLSEEEYSLLLESGGFLPYKI